MKNIKFPFTVQLAGDSIWDYEGPQTVIVTAIDIEKNDEYGYHYVNVSHNTTWRIYTDTGFERAISEAIGFYVCFTERGMQENGIASLES